MATRELGTSAAEQSATGERAVVPAISDDEILTYRRSGTTVESVAENR